jgi:hypothetical protein
MGDGSSVFILDIPTIRKEDENSIDFCFFMSTSVGKHENVYHRMIIAEKFVLPMK